VRNGVAQAMLPPEAPGGGSFLPLLDSGGLWVPLAPGHTSVTSASVFTLPLLCLPGSSPFMWTPLTEAEAHPKAGMTSSPDP
jgi:hypothetical protein